MRLIDFIILLNQYKSVICVIVYIYIKFLLIFQVYSIMIEFKQYLKRFLFDFIKKKWWFRFMNHNFYSMEN